MVFNPRGMPGLPESGDTLVATFTEPLTMTDSTPTTVTLFQAAGVTTISIPKLTAGPVVIPGGGGYFGAGGGGSANWPANVDRTGATVTVTLTGACSGGGCASLNPTGGAPVAMHINLAIDLKDAVPLPAIDTTPTIQWF
jgi:hypothetical protein